MNDIKGFFKKQIFRRILIIVIFTALMFAMQKLITLFLFTFIFAYLFNAIEKLIARNLRRFIPVNDKAIVVILYLAFLGLVVLAIAIYTPQAASQISAIGKTIFDFIKQADNLKNVHNVYLKEALAQVQHINVSQYATNGGKYLLDIVGNVGISIMYVSIAYVLSLFFIMEKATISRFIRGFKHSKLGFLYDDTRYFGIKFADSFGKVIEAQLISALVNAILSVIVLSILHFTDLLGLGILIFVLSLIPVAGVFFTLVPLSIIAYSIGGLRYIIYVIILTLICHLLENYVVKPKLLSGIIDIPMSLTLLILIISEHFLGTWGLIIGIPIAMFLFNIIGIETEKKDVHHNNFKKIIKR